MSDAQTRIDQLVKSNDIVLFMKGNASFPMCGFSGRAIQILKACGVETKTLKTVNVLEDEESAPGHQGIQQLADHSAALRQGRIRRWFGHHDGDVPVRRTAAGHHRPSLKHRASEQSHLRVALSFLLPAIVQTVLRDFARTWPMHRSAVHLWGFSVFMAGTSCA